jgi:hypothetical protein
MIQIIRGVYGYMDKDGIVRAKGVDAPPFELQPEQEARLVRLGVAQYVGTVNQAPEEADLAEDLDLGSIDESSLEERPLEEYSVKELRELGKDYGLTFKVGISKAEMVKAIEEAEAALEEDDDDGESAPVFDPAEAVQ